MKCRPGARERVRLAAGLATALCAVLGSSVASAENAVTLEVLCAELTREELAAVEARSRTELIVRRADSGHLVLNCDESCASASFSRVPGSRRELKEALSEPNARADQLVALVGQLLDEAHGAQAPRSAGENTPP